jgi:hypothetical protein
LNQYSKFATLMATLLIMSLTQPASASVVEVLAADSVAGGVNSQLDGTTRELAFAVPVPAQNKVLSENYV